MELYLVVRLEGDELVAYRADGPEHSRWHVLETDLLEELERLEQPATPVQRVPVWSFAALDEALQRQGYRRLADWTAGHTGPACHVTSNQP